MTRDEAITYLKVIWNRYKDEYEIERETLDAYHMAIEALQTEVVHCGDCQWHADVTDVDTGEMYHICGMLGVEVDDEHYCSYGVRKEGE